MPLICIALAQVIAPLQSIQELFLINVVAPQYVVAMSVNCAMSATAILAAITLRFILVRLNKKLEQVCFHP